MLDQIVQKGCDQLSLSKEIILKLIKFIDFQKVKGITGGYAASAFGDYLGFLRITDNEYTQAFFGERWGDHMVRTPIPQDWMKFLNAEAPLFTPSRLEPQYNDVKFYDAGIEKTLTGMTTNLHNHGTVRKAPPTRESYENFIIEQFLPKQFFIELLNESIPTILSQGLPEVTFDTAYPLHLNEEDARHGLNKLLHNELHRMVSKSDLMKYTLAVLDTSKIEINSEVFFTRNDIEAGSARAGGYFYIGAVPAKAIKVADKNIT